MTGPGRETRARRAAMLSVVMTLALSGCSLHKKAQPFTMPPFTPVELTEIPAPSDSAMVEVDEDDTEDLPPVPVAEGATTPKRQKKKPVKAPVPSPPVDTPPVQVAEAAAPPPPPPPLETGNASIGATVIGQLTPGGDLDPQIQKEAADLIAANERRLNALPAETVRAQAVLVSNVRNFQKQAQQALRAGDAGGAKTLATKGKLLLDDLEKAAGL